MNYVISLLKDVVAKRRLIADLAKADFRKRFEIGRASCRERV